ncbi:MAG: hypothetical protein ACK52I_09065 [Pseudomonadota bacterium]|jgi:hypothetical protein
MSKATKPVEIIAGHQRRRPYSDDEEACQIEQTLQPGMTVWTEPVTGSPKEGVSERFVGQMIRLAYLAPEALVVKRRPPAISINEMVEVAKLPWGEQMGRVLGISYSKDFQHQLRQQCRQ